MSDHKIDQKLKEDVRKVFDKNSDNIQYVQDVLHKEHKLNIKVENNQEEYVYQKLLQSKKAAQIALNLYNANVIYKDLKILTEWDLENPCEEKISNSSCSKELSVTNESYSKNPSDEEPSDGLRSNDYVGILKVNNYSSFENPCKNESCNNSCSEEVIDTNESNLNNSHDEEPSDDDDHARKSKPILPNVHHDDPIGESFSVDKPDKSELIDKLYKYVFYFLIARNLEIFKIYKTIFGKERSEDFICQFCDTNISSTDLECPGCGESLLTIYEKEIDKYEQSKIEEIKINKNLATNSVANKDVINNDDNKLDKESDSQLAGKHGDVNLDGNKWKCKHCGVVNEDGNVNCSVCLVARAEWNCRKCTFANETSSHRCKICDQLRENKADDNNDDDRVKDGRTESLTCWFGECKMRNNGNELYCKNCGLDKSANRERGATVDMNINGKKEQVWICFACNNINYDLYGSLCSKCHELKVDGKDGSINKYNNKNIEKDGRTESWICLYVECKKRNNGNELYCKNCGLDKSANRERGATVDMIKFGKIEQVWICYACNNINYELNKAICGRCLVSKFDVKGENENIKMIDVKSGSNNGKHKLLDDYEVIPSYNDNNMWKCKKCQCGNDRESLSCKQCQSPIIDIWSCKKCSMRNQISNDYCVVCGEENVNKIVKYCSKCKHGEIICDDLCEDCLKARDEIWTCWYRFCANKNSGNVKYCKYCGLDRYANKINIGAPMWRCKGDVPAEIWICDKCSIINDISRYCCQNYPCFGTNKYRKWCYKCGYKYNHEYNVYCEMCKDKISSI